MLQLQEREEMDRVLCGIDAIRGVITEFYIALEYFIILRERAEFYRIELLVQMKASESHICPREPPVPRHIYNVLPTWPDQCHLQVSIPTYSLGTNIGVSLFHFL